ncbi:hypothetical protein GT348_07090 [Aristophania vespae]|uniref:ArsR family transcriptional regulator n=1 Tax=Aristophania vespae TaxID=2697033 RepID=A0A6P1NEZ2_9PROT|nr:hypothetical protein [Aristophania vespae]QHI96028.1 hypothetical protein GT348_07090 [Aristophania vespae]
MKTHITEERRWRILSFLADASGRSLNEDVLLLCFRELGFPTDVVELRHDLDHLERHGCVKLIDYRLEMGRHLFVVRLTAGGLQTWRCERPVSGVAGRKPL